MHQVDSSEHGMQQLLSGASTGRLDRGLTMPIFTSSFHEYMHSHDAMHECCTDLNVRSMRPTMPRRQMRFSGSQEQALHYHGWRRRRKSGWRRRRRRGKRSPAMCTGWTPSSGEWKGKGGSCATSGWSEPWCYVSKDYQGAFKEFKKPSAVYQGRYYAPCKHPRHPLTESGIPGFARRPQTVGRPSFLLL